MKAYEANTSALIVLPLLDVYRKYYGLKMALYIGAIFYLTMALSAIVIDLAFKALHLVPERNPNVRAELMHFSFDYTFWLNLIFGALAAWLVYLNWQNPMDHGCHHEHEEHEHDMQAPDTAHGVRA